MVIREVIQAVEIPQSAQRATITQTVVIQIIVVQVSQAAVLKKQ